MPLRLRGRHLRRDLHPRSDVVWRLRHPTPDLFLVRNLGDEHVPLRVCRVVLLGRLRSRGDPELLRVRELWHSDVPAERDVGAVLRRLLTVA